MIHERLQEMRIKHNYKQKVLGDLLNMTPEGYGHYESGKRKPSPEAIATLAQFYNVSADYLLGTTDDPTPPADRKATPEEIESGIMEAWESVGLFDPNISDAKRDLIIKITKNILESDM